MDSTRYYANSVVTSPSMPVLLKVKNVNSDYTGSMLQENNAISSGFVKIMWDWQLIRFSEGCRFS